MLEDGTRGPTDLLTTGEDGDLLYRVTEVRVGSHRLRFFVAKALGQVSKSSQNNTDVCCPNFLLFLTKGKESC